MNWRVDRVVESDDTVVLCISGQITKQDVDTLRAVVEGEASAVAFDLVNVVLADREVVKFLAQRESNGTVLRNCPLYIREWVTRERTEMMETSGDFEDA
jgi:glycerol-3-phosphate responsive antiterminator